MKKNQDLAIGVINPCLDENIVTNIINVLSNINLNIIETREILLSEDSIDEYLSSFGHMENYPELKEKYLKYPVHVLAIKGENVFEMIKELVTDNDLFIGTFSYSTNEKQTNNCLELFFPYDNVSRTKRPTKKQ